MYCLACARAAIPDSTPDDPVAVLETLRDLGSHGHATANRFFFGIVWDDGRSPLCYRCRRSPPVRLGADQRAALENAFTSGAR
jgi:hypothetical protein